jgi:uncharacterized protein (TIGR03437 family)
MIRVFLGFVFTACVLTAETPQSSLAATRIARAPLTFEATGQHRFTHFARAGKGAYYFAPGEVDVTLGTGAARDVVRMRMVGANPHATPSPIQPTGGKSNYLLGKDPSKWVSGVPQFAALSYSQIYPGIDLIYYGNQSQLEHDFVVAPGGDPRQIRVAFQDVKSLRIDPAGELIATTRHGELRQKPPIVYQTIAGRRVNVPATYRRTGKKEIGFELAAYDRTQPLVIDPVVAIVTFQGGPGTDLANAIAVANGNAFVAGAGAALFPVMSPFQGSNGGSLDVTVSKYGPDGVLIFSTFIGGDGNDQAYSIALGPSGQIGIVGITTSTNFPTTSNAQQKAYGTGGDGFFAVLNPTGNALMNSTYVGASGFDQATGIVFDPAGNTFVTGSTNSPSFFTSPGAFQPGNAGMFDTFLREYGPTGSLLFSTLFGGPGIDGAAGVVLSNSNVVIAGNTPNAAGNQDVFFAKFSPTGSFLQFSSFGGPGQDFVNYLSGLPNGFLVGGSTSGGIPTTSNAFLKTAQGNPSGYVATFDSNLNPLYTSYLPGTGTASVLSGAYDPTSKIYAVAESLASPTNSVCPGSGDHSAMFLFSSPTWNLMDFSCFNGDVNGLTYGPNSTLFGVGTVFQPGTLPITGNANSSLFGGGDSDGFVYVTAPPGDPFAIDPAPPIFLPPDTGPIGTVFGDLNGDGTTDLISLNQISGSISTMLGVKSGIPSSATTFPIASLGFNVVRPTGITAFPAGITGALGVAISDISNSSGTGTGQILFGLFGAGAPVFRKFTATPGATGLMSGDLNEDGFPDLVFVDFNANNVASMLNDGTNFFLTPSLRDTGGFVPVSAALADVNDDDHIDLTVLNQGPAGTFNQSNVSFLIGNGTGKFATSGTPLPLPIFGTSIVGGFIDSGTTSRVVDFNNDGFPDFAVAGTGLSGSAPNGTDSLVILLSNGSGGFGAQPPFPLVGRSAPDSRIAFELSKDPALARAATVPATNVGMPMAAADFDADGNWDLAVANPRTNAVTVFRGDGAGHLTRARVFLVGEVPSDLKAADVNGDGMLDLIVTTSGSSTVQILLNRVIPATAPLPLISARGVTNAGSFKGGAVSAGEIVTLFGSAMGPASLSGLQLDSAGKVASTLAGTQVLFDGAPAPMIYTLAGQISAIVPYSVASKPQTQIQVVYQNRKSNVIVRPVAATRPALFTQNSSGTGAGAILNQDYTVNTPANAAARGAVIQIYATGEGQTNPAGVDGQVASAVYPKPLAGVTATVGGLPADVVYAGAAPLLVSGVLQVNVTVPAGVTPGPSVPISIKVGQAVSQPGVTVAVK